MAVATVSGSYSPSLFYLVELAATKCPKFLTYHFYIVSLFIFKNSISVYGNLSSAYAQKGTPLYLRFCRKLYPSAKSPLGESDSRTVQIFIITFPMFQIFVLTIGAENFRRSKFKLAYNVTFIFQFGLTTFIIFLLIGICSS